MEFLTNWTDIKDASLCISNIPKVFFIKYFYRDNNDIYRPATLTSLIIKTLEKIMKSIILTVTERHLNPLQFEYRPGRGVEDAKLFIFNTLYRHLEGPHTHARVLFRGFSSAFNTM